MYLLSHLYHSNSERQKCIAEGTSWHPVSREQNQRHKFEEREGPWVFFFFFGRRFAFQINLVVAFVSRFVRTVPISYPVTCVKSVVCGNTIVRYVISL
jgi:hypothetical protein